MNKKQSFILHQEYERHLELLSDEQKGKLLTAIFKYNAGEEYELDQVSAMAFSFIKSDLDYNRKRYLEQCEKNKENANKRWKGKNADAEDGVQNNPSKDQEIEVVPSAREAVEKDANPTESTNKYAKLSENVIRIGDNAKECDRMRVNAKHADNEHDHEYDLKKRLPKGSLKQALPSFDFVEMLKIWNQHTGQSIKKSDSRKRELKSFFHHKDYCNGSMEFWSEYCERIGASDFLMNRSSNTKGRSFQATINWVMKPKNADNVLDGNYDESWKEKGRVIDDEAQKEVFAILKDEPQINTNKTRL